MIQDLVGEEIVEDVDEVLHGSPFAKNARHLKVPLPRPKGRLPPKRGGKACSPSPVIIPDFQECAEIVDDGVAAMDQEMADGLFNSPRVRDLELRKEPPPSAANGDSRPVMKAAAPKSNAVSTTPAPKPADATSAPLRPQPPAQKRVAPQSPRAGASVAATAATTETAEPRASASKPAAPAAPAAQAKAAAGQAPQVRTRARGASFKRGTAYHQSVAAEPTPDLVSTSTRVQDSPPPRGVATKRERGASFKRGTSFHRSTAVAKPAADGDNKTPAGTASLRRGPSFKRGASFKRGPGATPTATATAATTAPAPVAKPSSTKVPASAGAKVAPTAPTSSRTRPKMPPNSRQPVAVTALPLDGATMVDDVDPLAKSELQVDVKALATSSAGAPADDTKPPGPTFVAGAAGLPSGAAGKRRMSVKDRQRRSSIIRNAALGISDANTDANVVTSAIAPPEEEEPAGADNSPSKDTKHRRRRTSVVYKGRATSVSQV